MAMRWQIIAYVLLLLTCSAGVFRFGPWSVVASASCLALMSLVANQTASVPPSRLIGEPAMVAGSVLNSAAIASAAYIFGYVSRWAWGL